MDCRAGAILVDVATVRQDRGYTCANRSCANTEFSGIRDQRNMPNANFRVVHNGVVFSRLKIADLDSDFAGSWPVDIASLGRGHDVKAL